MADVGFLIEGVKGAKELYKWWKKKKGRIFRVLINGKEKIVRIKGLSEELGGHFVLVEDLLANESPRILDVKEIKPIEELSEKEVKRFLKKIDLLKAVNLIKRLTTEKGGVLSHKVSIPLPSPSAQCLMALSELERLFPENNILSKEERMKRVRWLSELQEWRDWEDHELNCFALSSCIWALSTEFYHPSVRKLKRKIKSSIRKASLLLIENFNYKEGGWSWKKDVEPIHPFYTFFAIKALREARKIIFNEIAQKTEEIEPKVREYLYYYLQKNKDTVGLAMSLWGIHEIEGETLPPKVMEETLVNIFVGIEKMEAIPLHTKPIEFHLQFFMPMAVIPMILTAPDSPHTLRSVQRVFKWMKEKQNEGWGWGGIKEDASWATAWVLLIFSTVVKNLKLLQEILT